MYMRYAYVHELVHEYSVHVHICNGHVHVQCIHSIATALCAHTDDAREVNKNHSFQVRAIDHDGYGL